MNPVVRSFVAKKEEVQPDWFLADATGEVVGRLAVRLATVLMGKHKPSYTPHVDCGDFVVVVNAEKIRFTGRTLAHPTNPNFTTKMVSKEYEWFTGYPGGRKVVSADEWLEKHPERIIMEAVRRMLPKNKLGRKMLKKLRVFAGPNHKHQAQQPQPFPEYIK
ncbi:MAG: 50S ribosomal protein L13 [Planctomycetaceae bacterium]|nr:50S ribosomal protein L13 [Planctomycetaceae bacterium]MCA9031413.1 50S ribosomal protein L13 [Planctomycetaceae bacterium]MCA9045586.1 50S ribosomal protein L13 [Planctomycetaceae bacterium]MCB9953912.1 50S ribosomal protein L13 [Planctomycetaceae bacterium]